MASGPVSLKTRDRGVIFPRWRRSGENSLASVPPCFCEPIHRLLGSLSVDFWSGCGHRHRRSARKRTQETRSYPVGQPDPCWNSIDSRLLRWFGIPFAGPLTDPGTGGDKAERWIGIGSDTREAERRVRDRYPIGTVEGKLRSAKAAQSVPDCEQDHGAWAGSETIEERKPGTSRGCRRGAGPTLRE
jgi:hypothetical protein